MRRLNCMIQSVIQDSVLIVISVALRHGWWSRLASNYLCLLRINLDHPEFPPRTSLSNISSEVGNSTSHWLAWVLVLTGASSMLFPVQWTRILLAHATITYTQSVTWQLKGVTSSLPSYIPPKSRVCQFQGLLSRFHYTKQRVTMGSHPRDESLVR